MEVILNSSFFISFYKLFFSFILIFLIFIIIFIPIISSYPNINFNSNTMLWPIPEYFNITSQFGYRKAPTSGSSTYHSGIDIAAPSGSTLIAVFSGTITYTGFSRCRWIYNYSRK